MNKNRHNTTEFEPRPAMTGTPIDHQKLLPLQNNQETSTKPAELLAGGRWKEQKLKRRHKRGREGGAHEGSWLSMSQIWRLSVQSGPMSDSLVARSTSTDCGIAARFPHSHLIGGGGGGGGGGGNPRRRVPSSSSRLCGGCLSGRSWSEKGGEDENKISRFSWVRIGSESIRVGPAAPRGRGRGAQEVSKFGSAG